MSLWLICRADGSEPRVVRASSRDAAVRAHSSLLGDGNWCIWRLGNFPEQFEIKGMAVRQLGRPHIEEGAA